ncbi:MAG: hypothetical protein HY547_04420 [Elusimicrobia bacterium]|nr:hypothetical protein [Elusimicrobiota bacterium]
MKWPIWLLSILALAPPAAEGMALACSDEEEAAILENPGLSDDPVLSIAQNASVSDFCKKKIFDRIERSFKRRLKQGLCLGRDDGHDVCAGLEAAREALGNLPGKFCQERPENTENTQGSASDAACLLDPEHQDIFETAEERMGNVLFREIDAIENKFLTSVPRTLIPPECEELGRTCRQALAQTWLQDTVFEKSASKKDEEELWIEVGSYLHLLLSQAFTGDMQEQDGGTCGIYSGASLMEHYCLTPSKNPQASFGSVTLEGPGFSCAESPQDFLDEAFKNNVWTAQLCLQGRYDPAGCEPITRVPLENWVENLQDQYRRYCIQTQAVSEEKCQKLDEETERYRYKSAQEYLGVKAKKFPKAIIFGSTGINLESTPKLYAQYGFETALLDPKMPNTWEQIEESLRERHPIQIQVDPKHWAHYEIELFGDHIIILEGLFVGPRSVKEAVVRDSNFPQVVKIFPAETIRQSWVARGAPAVSLCAPSDPRKLCVEARRASQERIRQKEKARKETERLERLFPANK